MQAWISGVFLSLIFKSNLHPQHPCEKTTDTFNSGEAGKEGSQGSAGRQLLQFEWEMSLTELCVWSLGPQFPLLDKVIATLGSGYSNFRKWSLA